jgi:hypothetical protein
VNGAQSTRIVPAPHGTHQNAEGIAEVRRILKLHLKNKSVGSALAIGSLQALTSPPSKLQLNEPAVTLALMD